MVASYPSHQASAFLGGADPWVIAQALCDGSTVVTHESHAGPGSKKVKIPNVCEAFGVRYIKIYDLLRIRGARLGA